MLLTVTTARFLLLFVLVAGTLSAAYLVQGGDEKGSLVVPAERKVMQTVGNKILGRKMVSDYYNINPMTKEMMREESERSKYSRKSRKLMHRENFRARFVAFNADYKGPRHHPPKNN